MTLKYPLFPREIRHEKKSKKVIKKKFHNSLGKTEVLVFNSLGKKAFFELFDSSMGDYRSVNVKNGKRSNIPVKQGISVT